MPVETLSVILTDPSGIPPMQTFGKLGTQCYCSPHSSNANDALTRLFLGYKKTCTTPHRTQGISVSERVHSTMHAVLAMHSSMGLDNWAELLLMVQLAYNTSFSATSTTTSRCNPRNTTRGTNHGYRRTGPKHKRKPTNCF